MNFIDLFLQLAEADKIGPLNRLPGCWERKIDEHWTLWVNAHRKSKPAHGGVEVAPFHFYVEFNGWPAGLFHLSGGQFAAGSLANEETFCEAMTAAILKARAMAQTTQAE